MTPTTRGSRSLVRSLSGICVGVALVSLLGIALPGPVLDVVGLGTLGCGEAFADPHPELRDFLPSGHYVLHVDGKSVPKAEIFHSEKAAAYLIRAEAFDVAVLVMPRNGCVEAVESDQVVDRAREGAVDVLGVPAIAALHPEPGSSHGDQEEERDAEHARHVERTKTRSHTSHRATMRTMRVVCQR